LIAVRLVMSAGRVMAAECGAALIPACRSRAAAPAIATTLTAANHTNAGVGAIAYAFSSTSSNSTDATADPGCPVTVTGRTSVRDVINGSFA
jgi:hypothetical protein